MVGAADCTGNQATTESNSAGNIYVAQGQAFHVNINLPGISPQQLTDIQNGIKSWAGTSGITIVFDSTPAGPGVVTVGADTSIPSDGQATYHAGGAGYAVNQTNGGNISFNLGYTYACNDGTCKAYDPAKSNADSYLTGLAAHEMGHVLGLFEPTDTQKNPCTQTSTSVMGGQCGTNNLGDPPSGPAPTSISPTDCDKQAVAGQTGAKGSTASGPGTGGTGSCTAPTSTPTCMQWSQATCSFIPICGGGNCCGTSPIVIDTDHSGFNLTSKEGGVLFDFFGTGTPIQVAWTAPGSTNGWLALDRNGNGKIDCAQELFGNLTPQPSSATPNGYLALAVYDTNGDGVIDNKDPIWP